MTFEGDAAVFGDGTVFRQGESGEIEEQALADAEGQLFRALFSHGRISIRGQKNARPVGEHGAGHKALSQRWDERETQKGGRAAMVYSVTAGVAAGNTSGRMSRRYRSCCLGMPVFFQWDTAPLVTSHSIATAVGPPRAVITVSAAACMPGSIGDYTAKVQPAKPRLE